MGLKFSKEKQLNKKTKKSKKEGNKATADKWFSRYIRLVEADENGFVTCCTCGVTRYYNDDMHNGHFVHRDRPLTRYHEQNCANQCLACNTFQNGKEAEHEAYIAKKYGPAKPEELKELGRRRGSIVPKQDYAAISDKYRKLANIEAKKRGIKFGSTTWSEFEKTGIIRK